MEVRVDSTAEEYKAAMAEDYPFISKTRITFYHEDTKWEVDNFSNTLYIVENEYTDGPAEIPPALLPFIVKDVTDDERYTNAQLAQARGRWPCN